MEVIKRKKLSKLSGFNVFPNAVQIAKPVATKPKPTPKPPPVVPAPPPLAAASTLPPRAPLQPAQKTLSGLPLAGHPGQQHTPLMSQSLNNVQFYRCRCGLLLAEHKGRLWWVPVSSAMIHIETPAQLAEVLVLRCGNAERRRRIAADKAKRERRRAEREKQNQQEQPAINNVAKNRSYQNG